MVRCNAVLFDIHDRGSTTKISRFWGRSADRFIFILMKTKHPVLIVLFGVLISDGNFVPPFIFTHSLKLNTETSIKCPEEVMYPGSRRWLLESPKSGNKTLYHAAQAGESSFGFQKISQTTLPQTYGRLNPQITIPLILVCRAQLIEKPTRLCAATKMNWKQE